MDDIQGAQLNKLNQHVVEGGILTEEQKQLRNELTLQKALALAPQAQLNKLNLKLVEGEKLTKKQKQLRNELAALQKALAAPPQVELMQQISQDIKCLRKDQSKEILRQFDPWQKMSATSVDRVKSLRSKYAELVPPCCVISRHNKESNLTLAHILPHSTDANIQQIVGISNKLNTFRNVMWLCSALESAFDRLQLSFEPVDALNRTKFKLRIWDPAILEIPLYKGATETISSIVDAIIDFSQFEVIPFRRFLSYHTLVCYWRHLDSCEGKLPDAFDDISEESAGDGVKRLREKHFDEYLTQHHFEMLEETESDNASRRKKTKMGETSQTPTKKRNKYTIAGLRKRTKKMRSSQEACGVVSIAHVI